MAKTAIVVDDDKDTVRIFRDLLEEEGVEVLGVGYSGKQAFELYAEKKPDVVFIDVMMPEGSGMYGIRKIREVDPNAKVVAVTADMRSLTEEKLTKLKVSGIVYKPFDIEKIMQLINQ